MFNQYPYLNIQDLNLDYILKAIREMRYEVTNFVSINAIKYADPIQWNITSQYEKNTIVIDPVTGTAYISVAPVPAGVALTRPEYWTVVFDLGSFVTRAAQNFTDHWESETTTTATFASNAGDWLVWGDVLYKALTNITAGDTYVVGSNIEHFTIEDVYNSYLNTIANILALIGTTPLPTTAQTITGAVDELHTEINYLSTYVTPEMFGAVGDDTVDDTAAFVAAIASNKPLLVPSKTYRLTSPLVINSNYIIVGTGNSVLHFVNGDGLKIIGRNIIVRGLNLQGERAGIGISLGDADTAYTKNILADLIIARFDIGIQNFRNVYAAEFDNIRIDYAVTKGIVLNSILSSGGNKRRNFSLVFKNVYCNQCESNLHADYTDADFLGCNFGFLHVSGIDIVGDSTISFNSTNFECDAQVESGTLIQIEDSYVDFNGCSFIPSTQGNLKVFDFTNVKSIMFSACTYYPTSNCVLFDSTISALKYGAIKLLNNDFPTIRLIGEAHSYLFKMGDNANVEYFDKSALTTSKMFYGMLLTKIDSNYRPIGFAYFNGAVVRENEIITDTITNVESAINAQGTNSTRIYYIDNTYTGTLPESAYSNGNIIVSKQVNDAIAILFPVDVTLPPIMKSLTGGSFSNWYTVTSQSILKSKNANEQVNRIGSIGIGNDGTDYLSIRLGDGSLFGKIRFEA